MPLPEIDNNNVVNSLQNILTNELINIIIDIATSDLTATVTDKTDAVISEIEKFKEHVEKYVISNSGKETKKRQQK